MTTHKKDTQRPHRRHAARVCQRTHAHVAIMHHAKHLICPCHPKHASVHVHCASLYHRILLPFAPSTHPPHPTYRSGTGQSSQHKRPSRALATTQPGRGRAAGAAAAAATGQQPATLQARAGEVGEHCGRACLSCSGWGGWVGGWDAGRGERERREGTGGGWRSRVRVGHGGVCVASPRLSHRPTALGPSRPLYLPTHPPHNATFWCPHTTQTHTMSSSPRQHQKDRELSLSSRLLSKFTFVFSARLSLLPSYVHLPTYPKQKHNTTQRPPPFPFLPSLTSFSSFSKSVSQSLYPIHIHTSYFTLFFFFVLTHKSLCCTG